MAKHTSEELLLYQSLPLGVKIRMTQQRIRGWVNTFGTDGVYISFSGGKDSTVLLDIVRRMGYSNIPAVFVDVPTQYPELKTFAQKESNLEILKSKIGFIQVCEQYGFPLISKEVAHKMSDWESAHKHGHDSYVDRQMNGTYKSKNGKTNMVSIKKYAFLREAPFSISHKCCNVMKKDPLKKYEKETGRKAITAQMTDESKLRKSQWIAHGCNMFDVNRPISNPLSFWTEQDILEYIIKYDIEICSVYGDIVEDSENDKKYKCTGCQRTGCMLCGFGCHLEKSPNRFEILKETHPKMYDLLDVVKNNGVTFREAIEWTNEHGNLNIRL